MEIKFKRVHTVKDLVLSAIVLAAGIGLYFVHAGLGMVIGLCGLLMLAFYRAAYKKEGSDVVLKKKAFDVAHSCRPSIKDYLDGKGTDLDVSAPGNDGVVRLEVYFNQEDSVAYAQLFDFSNYTYEPATEVVELRGARADRLISHLA